MFCNYFVKEGNNKYRFMNQATSFVYVCIQIKAPTFQRLSQKSAKLGDISSVDKLLSVHCLQRVSTD